jgi:transposase InsO family protein
LFTRDHLGKNGRYHTFRSVREEPRVRLHRNAKTTPHMRALLVHRIRQDGWETSEAAEAAGISVRTAYKWLARYRTGGPAALEDAPSTPHRQPRRTSDAVIAEIVAARQQRLTGWAIAVRLQQARSTVARVLRRAGCSRLPPVEPPSPVRRYERTRPGELVHLDIKPLARILRPGHRIHGDRRQTVDGAGYEYVHVAVDDFSRVAHVEVLPDQTGPTTAGFLRRTVLWFARRGVRVERVLTDNGSAYVSNVFRAVATRLGLALKRTRPYRPQTNGKAERFIQTLLREWAYVTSYSHSSRRTQALRPWLRGYNTIRPHGALGYQPPTTRFPRAAQ